MGDCVEWCFHDSHVLVRDSKNPSDGPVLQFTRSEWSAFLWAARSGEADMPTPRTPRGSRSPAKGETPE
jgi:hypothetical protein